MHKTAKMNAQQQKQNKHFPLSLGILFLFTFAAFSLLALSFFLSGTAISVKTKLSLFGTKQSKRQDRAAMIEDK